ncbi:STAS/SEC14 domain-containing protein [Hydrogenimonas urashimensis]|uniref:STAS/SEC14 domain-containing protein n=1 Tax=Hydrogenimonas urashimensis TaxID=2740515 RepID=UPI00191560A8|nr:STAS/SEC14 domain-containing protein [Hydrogenimonas urashimensis]
MHIHPHGIRIDLHRIGGEVYAELALRGRLTHEDYETFVPVIENAMRGLPSGSLNLIIDMRRFEGWTPRAAWDDFRFGLEWRKDIRKMAVVGERKWEALFAKMADWMISGEAKYFETMEEARHWLLNRKS